jgi:transcriptional regulator with XRE-family HTH domain
MDDNNNTLGKILRQQRRMKSMPLHEVAAKSGVSSSYICRVENGKRLPSARILHKIAEPLGFEDNELLMLAGYLKTDSPAFCAGESGYYQVKRLDPYVASVLSKEPVETQYAVLPILNVLRMLSKGVVQGKSGPGAEKGARHAGRKRGSTQV